MHTADGDKGAEPTRAAGEERQTGAGAKDCSPGSQESSDGTFEGSQQTKPKHPTTGGASINTDFGGRLLEGGGSFLAFSALVSSQSGMEAE